LRLERANRDPGSGLNATGEVIRTGTVDDLLDVYALNIQVFSESWSFDGLRQAVEFGSDLYVCIRGNELAGYVLSRDVIDEVQIMQIAVAPAYRRRGIALALSRYLLQQKHHMASATLEVRRSNMPAQSLYLELGFRICGLRPDYYVPEEPGGEREDAVLMSLDLAESASQAPESASTSGSSAGPESAP
jgi:ribosomal-protein-alanine N-acetyltransferase